MRLALLIFPVTIAALALAARPAAACSVVRTFIPPTNYELVATTPRIVVAQAVDEVKQGNESTIALDVTQVLRGAGVKVGDRINVSGSTQRYLGPSAKHDFARPRKGAFAGSCTAWDYALGKHYLLLLDSYNGQWHTRGVPFTRVNEEVDATGDPWTIAVTAYIKIAELATPEARKRAFDALVARGGAKTATATDKAIAADVTTHLTSPTPLKTFAELEAMYTAAGAADRGRIAMAIGTGGDPAARAFMKDLVDQLTNGTPSIETRIALVAIGAYYLKVTDPAALGQIADLYVAIGSKGKQQRWDVMWLLIKRADASHAKQMALALAGADDEEAGRLGEWFVRFPSEAARQDLRRRVAGNYGDAYELTLALAGMGDQAVLAWAKKLATGKAVDDHRWVALYAIAASPLPGADALVPGIISRGGQDLVTLIQGYQTAQHPKVDARLAEIGKRATLTDEHKKWLERTLSERKQP